MARATRNSTVVQLMRSVLRRLEIARDMAVHAPLVPDWVISIHERTLAAIRSADFELIDAVMDEHQRSWSRSGSARRAAASSARSQTSSSRWRSARARCAPRPRF